MTFYLIYLFPISMPLPMHTCTSIYQKFKCSFFHIQILLVRKADFYVISFIYVETSPPCSFYFVNPLIILLTPSLSFHPSLIEPSATKARHADHFLRSNLNTYIILVANLTVTVFYKIRSLLFW